MGLFSVCEKRRLNKSYCLLIMGFIAGSAFFIPTEFCEIYIELCREFEFLVNFDKVFHFLVFAGLSFFVPLAQSVLGRVMIVFAILLLGLGIEAVQYYIPHRGASLHDLLANILGALIGLLMRAPVQTYVQRNRNHEIHRKT